MRTELAGTLFAWGIVECRFHLRVRGNELIFIHRQRDRALTKKDANTMYANQDLELAQLIVNALRFQEERDIRKHGTVSVNTEIELRRALAALEVAKQS